MILEIIIEKIIIVLLILISLFLLYLITVFGLSQIFIPNLRWKTKNKELLPEEVQTAIKKIVTQTKNKNKKELLQKIADYQLEHFHSQMGQAYLRFGLLFQKSFNKLWNKKGFLHCHQQGFILRSLLIETKRFTEKDIKIRIAPCYLNIHQYLLINTGEQKPEWIEVDVFAMSLGYPLGERLNLLHYAHHKKKKYVRRKIKHHT